MNDNDRRSVLFDTLHDPDTSPLHYQRALEEWEALVEAMDSGALPSLLELAQEAAEVGL